MKFKQIGWGIVALVLMAVTWAMVSPVVDRPLSFSKVAADTFERAAPVEMSRELFGSLGAVRLGSIGVAWVDPLAGVIGQAMALLMAVVAYALVGLLGAAGNQEKRWRAWAAV